MHRQRVDDQIGVAGRSEGLQGIEEAPPRGRIAGGSCRDEDLAPAVRERSKCPAVAVAGVRGVDVNLRLKAHHLIAAKVHQGVTAKLHQTAWAGSSR